MFTKGTLKFLRELEKNNNREWFEANKPRYESDVRECVSRCALFQ